MWDMNVKRYKQIFDKLNIFTLFYEANIVKHQAETVGLFSSKAFYSKILPIKDI